MFWDSRTRGCSGSGVVNFASVPLEGGGLSIRTVELGRGRCVLNSELKSPQAGRPDLLDTLYRSQGFPCWFFFSQSADDGLVVVPTYLPSLLMEVRYHVGVHRHCPPPRPTRSYLSVSCESGLARRPS